MFELIHQFHFSAAHYLPGYEGNCSKLHGHNYTVEVCLAGQLNEQGQLINRRRLEGIIQKEVLHRLNCNEDNETNLNDTFEMPSAEIIASSLAQQLKEPLQSKNHHLKYIDVQETKNSSARYCL